MRHKALCNKKSEGTTLLNFGWCRVIAGAACGVRRAPAGGSQKDGAVWRGEPPIVGHCAGRSPLFRLPTGIMYTRRALAQHSTSHRAHSTLRRATEESTSFFRHLAAFFPWKTTPPVVSHRVARLVSLQVAIYAPGVATNYAIVPFLLSDWQISRFDVCGHLWPIRTRLWIGI